MSGDHDTPSSRRDKANHAYKKSPACLCNNCKQPQTAHPIQLVMGRTRELQLGAAGAHTYYWSLRRIPSIHQTPTPHHTMPPSQDYEVKPMITAHASQTQPTAAPRNQTTRASRAQFAKGVRCWGFGGEAFIQDSGVCVYTRLLLYEISQPFVFDKKGCHQSENSSYHFQAYSSRAVCNSEFSEKCCMPCIDLCVHDQTVKWNNSGLLDDCPERIVIV